MITAVRLINYSFEILDRLSIPWELRGTRFWPAFDDDRFPLLRWADEYGVTYFSSYQMRGLIPELDLLHAQMTSEMARQTLDEVLRLARECRRHPHQYLVLAGE